MEEPHIKDAFILIVTRNIQSGGLDKDHSLKCLSYSQKFPFLPCYHSSESPLWFLVGSEALFPIVERWI